MKKYFLLIAAAATVFAVSCRKAREVEQVTTETPQEEIDDTTPQPVRFGSSLNIQVETKAAIDKFAGTEDLYVWGFERVPATNEAAEKYLVDATTGKAFINNVKATSPITAQYHPNTYEIAVYNPDGIYQNEYFYYTENKNYDFVAYYLGDAYHAGSDAVPYADYVDYNTTNGTSLTEDEYIALAPEDKIKTPAVPEVAPVVTQEGGVVSKVDVDVAIDGTNDIMLAKTDHEFDLLNRADDSKYVPESRMYSSYSSRRTVIPNLKFEHQLSRFIIKTKKGGLVPVNDITIEKIEIESKAMGKLYLYGAPENSLDFVPADNAAAEWLPLRFKDAVDYTAATAAEYNATLDGALAEGVALTDEQATAYNAACSGTKVAGNMLNADEAAAYNATLAGHVVAGDEQYAAGSIAKGHPGDGVFTQLGESVMIFPGNDAYNAKLYISQKNVTSIDPVPFEINVAALEAANGGVAVPGHQYTVNLIVYGAEKVEVTVSISEWVDAGEVDIDTDADETDNRTVTSLTGVPGNQDMTVGGEDYTITGVTVQSGETPADLDPQPALSYSSSDPAVATVSAAGVVHAVSAGTATITIKYAGSFTYKPVTATFTVTVN